MFPTDVVIVAGARTPMARYTGSFSDVSAIDLAAHASKEAIRRSGADPGEFDHAIFGNVMQTSADALYGARHVGLKAGLKIETPAVTVNRLCGSGIEAVAQGGAAIAARRSHDGACRRNGKHDAVAVCDSRGARGIEARRRRTGRLADGGPDRFFLRAADGVHRRETGRTAGDHAQGCGCLRFAEPASGGCRVQGVPHQGRACADGSKTRKKDDRGERRRSPAAGDDDGDAWRNCRRRSRKMGS